MTAVNALLGRIVDLEATAHEHSEQTIPFLIKGEDNDATQ